MGKRSHIYGRTPADIRSFARIDKGGRPNLDTPALSPCYPVPFSLLHPLPSPFTLRCNLWEACPFTTQMGGKSALRQ